MIRVNTELVVLNITVTNSAGQFVPGLRLSDFKIYEDGREVTLTDISSFSAHESPFASVSPGHIGKHGDSTFPGALGGDSFPGQSPRWKTLRRSLSLIRRWNRFRSFPADAILRRWLLAFARRE